MSPPKPSPEAIREAVEAISRSPGFQNSDRMVRFLRYIVERSLAGEADGIKEYSLGTEVFDRDASFDPKLDSIVRVEARRLRKKLAEYYESAAGDTVRISLPAPGYAPEFEIGTQVPFEPVPTRRPIPWKWIALTVAAAAVAGGVIWWRGQAASVPRSVAVLPFANLSGDASQEYFADGFTEEVIDRLTSIPKLEVAARTSSFEFKSKNRDVREIGKALNVDALVEGSIRREDGTLRITAQLVRTGDGYHIWSKSWDRPARDLLTVETEVASAIAESLAQTLTAKRATAPDLEAHDLYLLGRFHWNMQLSPEILKAIGYFEKAIERDPNYALAYSGLSEAYSYLIDLDAAPAVELAPKAQAAAEKALALDPDLAEAHTSLGLVRMDAYWDFSGAEKEFRRAVELKPRFAYGVHWLAHYFEIRNRLVEGCAEMQRAVDLDPLARMFRVDLVECTYKRRQFDLAATQLARAREADPSWPLFDLVQSTLDLATGDAKKSLLACEKAEKALGPDPMLIAGQAQAYGALGDRSKAAAQVVRLATIARKEYVPAYAFALASYAAGDSAGGFRYLDKAAKDHNAILLWLGNSPWFDQARRDPRASALLDRIRQ